MKRSLSIVLIFLILFLTSCTGEVSADGVLRNFCESYPLGRGLLYSSSVREGEEGYVSEELLKTLYGEGELPLYSSYAIYLYADMDSVRECGVFVVREGLGAEDDIVYTQDMFYKRIRTVRLGFPDSCARVMRFRNTIVYVIVPDVERAQRLLEKLLP